MSRTLPRTVRTAASTLRLLDRLRPALAALIGYPPVLGDLLTRRLEPPTA